MAYAENETCMKDLLTNLKELFKDYMDDTKGTTLANVKTFKRGVISAQNTVYPVLTCFPQREVIIQRRSNHTQIVERTASVEIYIKSYSPESSERAVLDYENAIRGIFYDSSYPNNYKLTEDDGRNTIINFEIEQYQFDNIDGDVVQELIIPIKFYSLEYVEDYSIVTTIEEETKDIGDQFRTVFKADSDLANVQFHYNNVIPPVPIVAGSAICIKERFSKDRHAWLGRDDEKREFHIYVWTKLSPYEGSLDLHLNNFEALKTTLEENSMWGGRSYYSEITRSEFGVNLTKMTYGTEITYVTNSFRVLPSY